MYLKESRKYLASAKSSRLASVIVARAEHLYGVDRQQIEMALLEEEVEEPPEVGDEGWND